MTTKEPEIETKQDSVSELPAIDTSIVFDKNSFKREANVLAVILPSSSVATVRLVLEPAMLHCKKVRNILDVPMKEGDKSSSEKMILLAEEYSTVNDVITKNKDTPIASMLTPFSEDKKTDDKGQASPISRVEHVNISLDWQSVSLTEILRKLIPAEAIAAVNGDIPTSFETIGHIAHLNLRHALLPYRHVIGEAILAKNPRLKTVVTKTATIENEYRTFPLAVIAGEPNLETDVRESGCTFRLNFADVYWNSRLQAEHARLVSTLGRRAIVWDLMAGIGPFALPAAKNGCTVHANDLNPRSYEYLLVNRERNGVNPALCSCYNLDARAFVRKLVSEHYPLPTHAIMNLPASALEFLDVFGEVVRGGWAGRPVIHCYCFSRSLESPQEDIVKRAREAIGTEGVVIRVRDVYDVRDVAPGKHMYLITLRVFSANDTDIPSEQAERDAHAQEIHDALKTPPQKTGLKRGRDDD